MLRILLFSIYSLLGRNVFFRLRITDKHALNQLTDSSLSVYSLKSDLNNVPILVCLYRLFGIDDEKVVVFFSFTRVCIYWDVHIYICIFFASIVSIGSLIVLYTLCCYKCISLIMVKDILDLYRHLFCFN